MATGFHSVSTRRALLFAKYEMFGGETIHIAHTNEWMQIVVMSWINRAPCASRAFEPASHIQPKQMSNKRKWLMSSVVSPLSASNDMLYTCKFPQKQYFSNDFHLMPKWVFGCRSLTFIWSLLQCFPQWMCWVLKLFHFLLVLFAIYCHRFVIWPSSFSARIRLRSPEQTAQA